MLRHRSRTYYKYLLSYLALLLSVVIALLSFSQAYFIVQLKDNLIDVHRSRLRQTIQQLDSDIQQLYTIDYQISSVNENFLSYYIEDPSPLRDLRLVNEFRNLLAPSTMIAEIALIEADADNVYTSTAVYAKPLFFDGIFSFDEWDSPAADLTHLTHRIVRPAERVNGTERYITFINMPSVFSRLQDAVLMFFVRESHFLNSLSPQDHPTQQGAILDENGQFIVSTLPLTEPVAGERLRWDGTDYLVLRESSAVTNWTYLFFLPVSEIFAPISRAQVTLFVFLLVVLLGGGVGIHMAMRMNYKPIQELTESLGRSGDDDLVSLRDTIGSLSAQNEHMRAQLMSSPDGQALKDALLFSLLKGKYASFEAYNQEAAALDMTFNKPCFQVLMLRLFDQEGEFPRQTLSTALRESLGDDFTWHFRDLFEQSMLVCLVGMEPGMEEELMARCRSLLSVCVEQYGLSLSIGASNCYDHIAQLPTACFEATQAVREHFIRGRHQLIRYSEMNHILTAQTNHLSMLSGLSTQTPDQQMQTIRSFIETIKSDKVPALLAKSYCTSAVQMLIASAANPVKLDDLFTISYLRTADDYLSFMLHMLDTAPKPLPSPAAPADTPMAELLQRIYGCIADNYDDCNFTVQDVADKLSMSSGYLSQYFKQQTGETLIGYVAQLRIRKACSLLTTTSMPLQMVAESVGYYNQNSFIRRFKQMTGMTPGEYRKVHQ